MKLRPCYSHWYPRFFGVEAITLYPWILFRQSVDSTSHRTMKHELAHVDQIVRDGWATFYAKYLWYMACGVLKYRNFWKAYRENPYEVEARELEKVLLTNYDIERLQIILTRTS